MGITSGGGASIKKDKARGKGETKAHGGREGKRERNATRAAETTMQEEKICVIESSDL
jgi:hypothetical protein